MAFCSQAAARLRFWLQDGAARSAASSPAPSMNDDLRRRMNCRPMTYIPGAATIPPSWRMRPLRSSTGTLQPGIVGAISRRPNHRTNTGVDQVQAEPGFRSDIRRLKAMRCGKLPRKPVRVHPIVDAGKKPVPSSDRRARSGSRAIRKLCLPSRRPTRRPTSSTPALRKLLRSTVRRSGVPTS